MYDDLDSLSHSCEDYLLEEEIEEETKQRVERSELETLFGFGIMDDDSNSRSQWEDRHEQEKEKQKENEERKSLLAISSCDSSITDIKYENQGWCAPMDPVKVPSVSDTNYESQPWHRPVIPVKVSLVPEVNCENGVWLEPVEHRQQQEKEEGIKKEETKNPFDTGIDGVFRKKEDDYDTTAVSQSSAETEKNLLDAMRLLEIYKFKASKYKKNDCIFDNKDSSNAEEENEGENEEDVGDNCEDDDDIDHKSDGDIEDDGDNDHKSEGDIKDDDDDDNDHKSDDDIEDDDDDDDKFICSSDSHDKDNYDSSKDENIQDDKKDAKDEEKIKHENKQEDEGVDEVENEDELDELQPLTNNLHNSNKDSLIDDSTTENVQQDNQRSAGIRVNESNDDDGFVPPKIPPSPTITAVYKARMGFLKAIMPRNEKVLEGKTKIVALVVVFLILIPLIFMIVSSIMLLTGKEKSSAVLHINKRNRGGIIHNSSISDATINRTNFTSSLHLLNNPIISNDNDPESCLIASNISAHQKTMLKFGRMKIYIEGYFDLNYFNTSEIRFLEDLFEQSYHDASKGECHGPHHRRLESAVLVSQKHIIVTKQQHVTDLEYDPESKRNLRGAQQIETKYNYNSINDSKKSNMQLQKGGEGNPMIDNMHRNKKRKLHHQTIRRRAADDSDSGSRGSIKKSSNVNNMLQVTILTNWLVSIQCVDNNCLDMEPMFSSPSDYNQSDTNSKNIFSVREKNIESEASMNNIAYNGNSAATTSDSSYSKNEQFLNLFVDTFSNALLKATSTPQGTNNNNNPSQNENSRQKIQSGYLGSMQAAIRVFKDEGEKERNTPANGLFLQYETDVHSESTANYDRSSKQDASVIGDTIAATTIIPDLAIGSVSNAQTQTPTKKLPALSMDQLPPLAIYSPIASPTTLSTVSPLAPSINAKETMLPKATTIKKSNMPSVLHSNAPSETRSAMPSRYSSNTPSIAMSANPSELPSIHSSAAPSIKSSAIPSMLHSNVPSETRSAMPSRYSSNTPSLAMSANPSELPSIHSSAVPSINSSGSPSLFIGVTSTRDAINHSPIK